MRLRGLSEVAAAQAVALSISALQWIVLAKLVEVAEYGEIGYLSAIGGLLSIALSLGMPETLKAKIPAGGNPRLAGGAMLLVAMASLVAYVPLAAAGLAPSAELAVTEAILAVAAAVWAAELRYREYAFTVIFGRAFTAAFSLAAAALGANPAWVVRAMAIGAGVAAVPTVVATRPRPGDISAAVEELRFAGPAMAAALVSAVGYRLDKVAVERLYGATALGEYQLGFHVFAAATVIHQIIFAYGLPEVAAGRDVSRFEALTWVGAGGVAVGSLTVLGPLFRALFPRYYPGAAAVGAACGAAIVPALAAEWQVCRELAEGRSASVAVAKLLGAAATLVGVWAFGWRGGSGPGAAVVFGAAVTAGSLAAWRRIRRTRGT